MNIDVLGISGSPVRNSNTDRLVQKIIQASGLEGEFIKLSTVNVQPCFACKGCIKDNTCTINDDFEALCKKLQV